MHLENTRKKTCKRFSALNNVSSQLLNRLPALRICSNIQKDLFAKAQSFPTDHLA